MKKLLTLVGALVLAVAVRAEGDFTKTMTPEEVAATGLGKLSPEELAKLKAVIERYRAGEIAVVEKKAEQQVATVKKEAETKVATVKQEAETKVAEVQKEAETKVAAADARAKEAETKATVAPAPAATATAATEKKKKEPNWLTALVTLEKTGKEPDKAEAVEARLVGSLSSFSGSRRFELDNGQVWQMIEPASYAGPKLDSPTVTIRPGSIGMFWLKIKDAALRVKVKPIKLQ